MKHDPVLAKLLLLDARDGDQEAVIANYPKTLVLEQKARLIEEGLADGKVIADGLRLGWVKNFRLKAAGHRWLEKIESDSERADTRLRAAMSSVRIFISHSSADTDLAESLLYLLERALHLDAKEIRCTSVVGYSLPVGTSIDDQLRLEIEQSEVLIALVTGASLVSTYVLFELGARWVLRKPLFPILSKGVKSTDLKEPLKGLAALSCDKRGHVLKLVEDVAEKLAVVPVGPTLYEKNVVEVLARSKQAVAAPRKKAPSATPLDAPQLSAHEIFALQAIFDGCTGPLIDEIIADSLNITLARAHQSLEFIRRKGLVECKPTRRGDIEYVRTEKGLAWLEANTRTGDI